MESLPKDGRGAADPPAFLPGQLGPFPPAGLRARAEVQIPLHAQRSATSPSPSGAV